MNSLIKLLRVLSSETAPAQISLGFCLAMLMGFTPLYSLHNLLVLLLVLVLRVNLAAFLLGFAFFSALAFALDPLFHRIGLSVLTAGPLQPAWTALYNTSLGRLSAFNNSIVMGSGVVSLIAFVPLVLLCNRLIVRYRETVVAWVKQTRIARMLRASRLYSMWQATSDWRS